MKDHESRPTGIKPFLEANFMNFNRGRGCGHGRGGGRDCGCHTPAHSHLARDVASSLPILFFF